MNRIKLLMYMSVRLHSNRSSNRKQFSGIQRQEITSSAKDPNFDVEPEEYIDDLAEDESDFMNVHKSYDSHVRELRQNKEKLKHRIVRTKYFKREKDPQFLTIAERAEIQRLHEIDPEEWTVEKLSESFPALPLTIKKILKAKWKPSSVEKILKYDENVMRNWEDFQRGKLALEPDLESHLTKFKDRKIPKFNREEIAKKLLPPKIELPKPKSTYFTDIVRKYIEAEQKDNQESININTSTDQMVKHNSIEIKERNECTSSAAPLTNFDQRPLLENETGSLHVTQSSMEICKTKRPHKKSDTEKKVFTFEEFMKDKDVHDLVCEQSPQEGEVLRETYQKEMQSKKKESQLSIVTADATDTILKNETGETRITTKEQASNALTTPMNKQSSTEVVMENTKSEHALDTYVKVWNHKLLDKDAVKLKIKIPANVFQKGKTYRIGDCYYDDDGEFLYRVPGLKD